MEQHDIQVNVDARKSEQGLRRFDSAIDRTERRLKTFAKTGESAFSRLAAVSGRADFSAMARQAGTLESAFSKLSRSTASSFQSATSASRRFANGVNSDMTRVRRSVGDTANAFSRLSSSITAFTGSSSGLRRASANLQGISGALAQFGQNAPALQQASRSMSEISRAIGRTRTDNLNALHTGLRGLSEIRARNDLSRMVLDLGQATRMVLPNRLSQAVHALRHLNGIRLQRGIAPGLAAIGSAFQSFRAITPGRVRSIAELTNTLRRLPNMRDQVGSLTQLGRSMSGFSSFSSSSASLSRFFRALETADPSRIRQLAAALRELSRSGISGMRIPAIGNLNVGRVGGYGYGGGGTALGGMRAGVSLPMGLGAFSVSNQLGMAVAAGAGALTVGSMVGSINQAGTSIDQFRLKMAVTAQTSGEVRKEWEFLTETADRLAMPLGVLTEGYGKFAASLKVAGYDMGTTQDTFRGFATGFRAMGMDGEQVRWALKALEQMATKDQVKAEELKNQLGEHFPGAINLMAQANGWTGRELMARMEQGQVDFDAVIRMAAHIEETFAGATDYSLQTAESAATRFQNRLMLLQNVVFKSGFEEGLKNMFDTFNEVLDSDTAIQNAQAMGEAFRWGFTMAGDAARWLMENIEGVKWAVGAVFTASALAPIAGMAVSLGGVAASVLGLSGAFGFLGLAGIAGGLFTVATRATALGGVIWGASEAFEALGVESVDWGNALVEIDGRMYTFGETAQAAVATAGDAFDRVWAAIGPDAIAAFDMLESQWDQTWTFILAKSEEGGGGVVGFFKQMSIDAIEEIRKLDPEFFAALGRIAGFFENGSDNPILNSYRDTMNGLIGITRATFTLIDAIISDMINRVTGVGGHFIGTIRDLVVGDIDAAYDHAIQGSMAFFGLNQETSDGYDRAWQQIVEDNPLDRDYLNEIFVGVREGGEQLETTARNVEGSVVSTFDTLTGLALEMLGQLRSDFHSNLGAAAGGMSGSAPASSAQVMGREDRAYQYYLGAGLDPVQAAALVGNLRRESNLDPTAANMNILPPGHAEAGEVENSHGIMQWRESRLTGLKEFAAAQGESWTDFDTQLAFVLEEFRTTEAGKWEAFSNATSVAEANAALKPFIRYGDDSLAERGAFGQQVLERNLGLPRDAMGESYQAGKEAELARIEAMSVERNTQLAIEQGPELTELNASELTYEQWARVDTILNDILATTGELTVSELDYRNAINDVVGEKQSVYDQMISQQRSEQMLVGLTAEERERELDIVRMRNQALGDAELIDRDRIGNLRTQISLTQQLAEDAQEAARWAQVWKDREQVTNVTPTWSEWQGVDTDALAGSLAGAEGDPMTFATAMREAREQIVATTDPYERMMMSMRDQHDMLLLTNTERSIEEELLRRKNELLAEGVVMTRAQEGAMRDTIAQMQQLQNGGTNGFANWVRGAEDFNVALARVEEQALDGLIDKMTDFITTGKADWQSLSNEIIRSVTKVVLNDLVKQFLSFTGIGGQQNGPMNMAFNAGNMMGGGQQQGQGNWFTNIFSSLFGGGGNTAIPTAAMQPMQAMPMMYGAPNVGMSMPMVMPGMPISMPGMGMPAMGSPGMYGMSTTGMGMNAMASMMPMMAAGGMGMMPGQGGGIESIFGFIPQLFMQLFGGFSEGGYSDSPVTSYRLSPAAFSNAPHFRAGGVTGDGGIPAVLHDDEAVVPLSRGRRIPVQLTGGDSSANDNARGSNVTINQYITTKDAPSFRRSNRQIAREASQQQNRASNR